MSNVVKVDSSSFSQALNDMLLNYTDDVVDAVNEATKEVADATVKVVKENANFTGEETGKYKKSIADKITFQNLTEVKYTVYVKSPHYRLAHLLEYGHATRNGGRTRAFPHFQKGQKYAEENYPKQIEKKVGEIK